MSYGVREGKRQERWSSRARVCRKGTRLSDVLEHTCAFPRCPSSCKAGATTQPLATDRDSATKLKAP
jgi:hypothetical protein